VKGKGVEDSRVRGVGEYKGKGVEDSRVQGFGEYRDQGVEGSRVRGVEDSGENWDLAGLNVKVLLKNVSEEK
jgi:hypothetical protein